MRLYAESSAILAFLLEESHVAAVRTALRNASTVVTSELSLIECDRVLHRLARVQPGRDVHIAERRAVLAAAVRAWDVMQISGEVVHRSRGVFPDEPLRTLDAIHVASAAVAQARIPGLHMLSLDRRVRANASSLGFPLLPAVL
jgi:predicted nucleic acid-binding protein